MTTDPASNDKVLKPHQTALVMAALAAFATTVVPALNSLTLPIQYFNTHTHELCHALTAVATGGQVSHIEVHWDGSGVTPIGGSILTFTASAGYVGASLIGALMILYGRTSQKAKQTMFALGAILALSTLIWVRGDLSGLLTGTLWATALLFGSRLGGQTPLYVVQFLGVMQCLYSLKDLLILLHLSAGTQQPTDALLMQSVSHVPAIFWALAWSGMSLVLMFIGLRAAWRSKA